MNIKDQLRNYYIDRLEQAITDLKDNPNSNIIKTAVSFYCINLEYPNFELLFNFHTKCKDNYNGLTRKPSKLSSTIKKELRFHNAAITYYNKLLDEER